ncbi:hypothetical protein G9A89_016843 [Geosiphon pyriformis]|nr:hypothetical protein G9A89_016843 [Geosiphon pyriformis]
MFILLVMILNVFLVDALPWSPVTKPEDNGVWDRLDEAVNFQPGVESVPTTAFYYTQLINHQNPTLGVFKQRFFVNSTFWKPGGPILIHASGESGSKQATVMYSGFSELAADLGALFICLEHRFYGESYPEINNLSAANLKYLTTELALQDVANFIRHPPYNPIIIPYNSRWITVGGSYSGMLAAWMRKKYPDLVFAAYSSSAPLKAELDFFEYDQVIANRLPCRDLAGKAIEYIDSVLDSKNSTAINELKKQFGLGVLEDNGDFASALNDQFNRLVGNYFPSPSNQPDLIDSYCFAFESTVDKTPNGYAGTYALTTKYFLKVFNYTTADDIRNAYSTTALSTAGRNNQISWMWQYCNYYGFYQTPPQPPSLRLRSKLVNATWYQNQCNYLWPDAPNKSPNVDFVNTLYGGNDISIDRVVFVNGDSDPWYPLTVSGAGRTSTDDSPIFVIKGGSHVTDLRTPTSVDWQSLKDARLGARNALKNWLQLDDNRLRSKTVSRGINPKSHSHKTDKTFSHC